MSLNLLKTLFVATAVGALAFDGGRRYERCKPKQQPKKAFAANDATIKNGDDRPIEEIRAELDEGYAKYFGAIQDKLQPGEHTGNLEDVLMGDDVTQKNMLFEQLPEGLCTFASEDNRIQCIIHRSEDHAQVAMRNLISGEYYIHLIGPEAAEYKQYYQNHNMLDLVGFIATGELPSV